MMFYILTSLLLTASHALAAPPISNTNNTVNTRDAAVGTFYNGQKLRDYADYPPKIFLTLDAGVKILNAEYTGVDSQHTVVEGPSMFFQNGLFAGSNTIAWWDVDFLLGIQSVSKRCHVWLTDAAKPQVTGQDAFFALTKYEPWIQNSVSGAVSMKCEARPAA